MNKNLIGYRHMLNLTQSQMAFKLGMSPVSYCHKETGKKDFTQTEIEETMKLLKEKRPELTYEEVFIRGN